MSGHSKWSKIKHKKEANDAQKGKSFSKLSKEISLAVKEGGGGDVNFNYQLRSVVDRAKFAKMPLSSIENAIAKGLGGGKDGALEKILYEGYFSGGVALLIECLTDNKNRSVAELRMALRKSGAELSSNGSVLWQFDRVGEIEIDNINSSSKEIDTLIDVDGLIDIEEQDKNLIVITQPDKLQNVRQEIEKLDLKIITTKLIYRPKEEVVVKDKDSYIALIERIEELEDVLNVWSNAKV